MQSIQDKLDAFPDFLAPLKEAASRYLKHPSAIAKNGTTSIGHRPWVAQLNYMFVLYPGISRESLIGYCRKFQFQLPPAYVDFLAVVNGAFCFGMSLCGIPPSMLDFPPLLDRTVLQCHDLSTAVTAWSRNYRVPAGFLHFGGRHFSFQENVGYFIDKDNHIISVRGKSEIIGNWDRFSDFLSDELRASEELEEKIHPSKWNG